MVNNKGKWLFCIVISFLCLTFSIILLNTAPLGADLPPLDSGNLPFSPVSGAYGPLSGGFLPQYGAPYGYGLPYQNMRPGYMLPAGQYNRLPFQPTGFNFRPNSPYGVANPYLNSNPYLLASSDTDSSGSSLPPYDNIYNASALPNQAFYGPNQNIYTPSNVFQQFPAGSPFNINSPQGNVNRFANQLAVPYGNMTPYSGIMSQQGFLGTYNMGTSNNPFLPINMLQQNQRYGMNINPYINPYFQYNTYQNNPYNPYQYNAGRYYPSGGGSSSDDNNNSSNTVELPDAKGHWAGTWEAWLTDPNEGVVTDPNGQIQISMSGDIHFHITDQDSDGGAVGGTVEITGWYVDPHPEDWPSNWTGEEDEILLTGWIDEATQYLMARYYYYPGQETSGSYDTGEDPQNILGMYTWHFNSNQLTITESGISGQFSINGTEGYYAIGVFSTAKYAPTSQ
jgi:hypothetical protein